MDLSDALSGCPGSGQQGNCTWPAAGPNSQQPGGPGCQGSQPSQPCWSGSQAGQPNPPSWPGQQASHPNSLPWPTQQPGQPNPPTWPGQQPGQPNQPTWPGNPPTQPSAPSWPGQQPSQPAPPSCPGQPNPPTTSGWPVHPGQPIWPGQPGGQAVIPGQPGWPSQNPPYAPQPWPGPPSGPLTVPYNLDLPSGVYDRMLITINGQVKPNAKMFTVDFLRGKDIAFHFNPRFNEGGKQAIVRNHKMGDRWGKEERGIQTQFPFVPNTPFEMKILCTFNEFKVAVNNTQVLEFKHRIRELSQINRLSIYNDINLASVRAETLP